MDTRQPCTIDEIRNRCKVGVMITYTPHLLTRQAIITDIKDDAIVVADLIGITATLSLYDLMESGAEVILGLKLYNTAKL